MISASKKSAFTLVELLVVISIILIATSVLFIGGNSGGDGLKLSSAQRIVSGIAQGARGQALLKSSKSRLIIYAETNDEEPDKALRFFGIIYADPDNANQWIAATQGTNLPEGIYFDPEMSSTNDWPRSTMQLEYPRQTPQPETGDAYYYYEFDSNGTTTSDFVNSWLVLRAGTLKPNSAGDLEVDFTEEDKENLKAALIFRRVGSTTLVTDPTEIQ